MIQVRRRSVAKNVNPVHIEKVALRRKLSESFPWRVSERFDEDSINLPEFGAVLLWCLQEPASSHIATQVASVNMGWLATVLHNLILNPVLSSSLGASIAGFSVGQNWGEEAWLSRSHRYGFYNEEIVRQLAISSHLEEVVLSVTRNPKLFESTIPFSRSDETQRISAQIRAPYEPDSTVSLISFAQTIEESAELAQVLQGYMAWVLAMTAVSLLIHDALDDIEDPSEDVGQSIDLVSVTNLDPQATTALAQTSERFIGLFSELLQAGELAEFDQAAGEHNLRQLLGEMQNPEGATGHVVRRYEMKMVEIYHRHIGIQGLRLVTDDETVKQVESAITQAIEMGNAVEPEEAARLAEPIPLTLLPSPSIREKFTSALGWTSGAALSATVAGAGGAKLIDGLGELGKILPAPWGAMIGAVLGLLAYTFKPKGKS
jgi:hypothetical protein